MSKRSPAKRTLPKPPNWWNMNVIPEMVPMAFNPYTSAVSEEVKGRVATQEKPAMLAKIHRPATESTVRRTM